MEGRVYGTGLVHGAGPRRHPEAAFNLLCQLSMCHFGDKQLCLFFNFEGEIFNFKMSAGNRDIGKRTVVLCVTCTSKRRRSCGPCLCGPLKRVAAEPIAETPGGLQSVSEPLSLASAPLRVLAVPLLPGWSWRPCGWNRAHWIQRSRRNTDGHSGRAVSIWVPALSPSCSVPTREGPKAASLSAVQLWAFCPRVKPPAAQHAVQPTPS